MGKGGAQNIELAMNLKSSTTLSIAASVSIIVLSIMILSMPFCITILSSLTLSIMQRCKLRHNTQHMDIEHNNTQHNDTQHNA